MNFPTPLSSFHLQENTTMHTLSSSNVSPPLWRRRHRLLRSLISPLLSTYVTVSQATIPHTKTRYLLPRGIHLFLAHGNCTENYTHGYGPQLWILHHTRTLGSYLTLDTATATQSFRFKNVDDYQRIFLPQIPPNHTTHSVNYNCFLCGKRPLSQPIDSRNGTTLCSSVAAGKESSNSSSCICPLAISGIHLDQKGSSHWGRLFLYS